MTLEKHEKALILSYRQIDRKWREVIWAAIKCGMQQKGLRIFFDN